MRIFSVLLDTASLRNTVYKCVRRLVSTIMILKNERTENSLALILDNVLVTRHWFVARTTLDHFVFETHSRLDPLFAVGNRVLRFLHSNKKVTCVPVSFRFYGRFVIFA